MKVIEPLAPEKIKSGFFFKKILRNSAELYLSL